MRNAQACIDKLAEKYGMSRSEAAGMYEEIMDIAQQVMSETKEYPNPWDLEADFVRLADPVKRQKVAMGIQNRLERAHKARTYRKLKTQDAAANTEAKILSLIEEALFRDRMKGEESWWKGLGKTDPTKAFIATMLGDGSGLPGSRDSVSRMREGFDRQDFMLLVEYFDTHPDVHKMLNGVIGMGNAELRQSYRQKSRSFFVKAIDHMMKEEYDLGTNESDFARVLAMMAMQSTDRFVHHGALITKRKGYTPFLASTTKITAVTREDFIRQTLDSGTIDWENSFYDLPNGHLARGNGDPARVKAAREEILGRMHDVYTGRAERGEAIRTGDMEAKGRDAVAARYEKAMQLRFVDGEAWMRFHEMWGRSEDPLGIITGKVNEQNRMASVMAAFGPEPENGAWIVAQRLISRIERNQLELSDKVKTRVLKQLKAFDVRNGQRKVNDLKLDSLKGAKEAFTTITNPDDGGLSMAFSELVGDTLYTVNGNAAKWASRVRVMKNMAVLGRSTITAMTDVPNILFANMARGRNFGESVRAMTDAYRLTRNIQKKEWDAIRPYIRMFADGAIGQYHSRFTLDEHGAMSRMQSIYFKVNFLTQWTDAMRQMSAATNMSWLGENAKLSWDDLSTTALGPRLKATLEAHGFTPEKWDAIREAVWIDPTGRPHVIPGLLDQMSNEQVRHILTSGALPVNSPYPVRRAFEERQARYWADPESYKQQLKADLIGMLNDEVRYGVIESDDRVRYYSVRGTKPGTLTGEIMRFMMQYKSYAIGLADRTFTRAAFAEKGAGARNLPFLPDAATVNMDLAKWIALSIVTGYTTQALSDVSKGYAPRPVTGEHGWQTFVTAFHKSGAGAVYGDVLFDLLSGYDPTWAHKIVGMGLGPTGDTAMDVLSTLFAGLKSGDKGAIKMFNLVMNNCPFANVFYGRLALDYAVLYHIENMLDPGSVARKHKWNAQNMGRKAFYTP